MKTQSHKRLPWVGRLLLAAGVGAGAIGCIGLPKPSGASPRHFVLTPLAAESAPVGASTGGRAVGVGFVKIPSYLFNDSIAVRQGTNEVTYLESALWAERLDSGLQRVLAANLGILLSTSQMRLSAWRPEEVSAEIYVTIEQFDVDSRGRGSLVAWWRVLAPGGESILSSNQFRAALEGPQPASDPDGATATMSALAVSLSRELAQAVTAASAGGSQR
jgi:uncharacterized lipoprotein YmbA